MSHGLFDCIGLRLPDWNAVTEFIHEHWDELHGYPTPDGWFNALWRDPTGAKVSVNANENGGLEAIPGFAGGPTALLTDIGWVEGTDALAAYVVDEAGVDVTRLCAAFDQWRFLPEVDCEETFEAIITGLALKIRSYANAAAFDASPDLDMGPLAEPLTLPDGKTLERLRFGSESFVPDGMFQKPWNPMARLSATVERSWTKTVEATGNSFHVARVTTVGALGIYLCWPPELAPRAEPGSTVYAEAYLTAMLPEVWRRQSQEPGGA